MTIQPQNSGYGPRTKSLGLLDSDIVATHNERAIREEVAILKPTTLGELLHWSYANLAMAHSAVTAKAGKYGRTHFMIRAAFTGAEQSDPARRSAGRRRTLEDGAAPGMLLLEAEPCPSIISFQASEAVPMTAITSSGRAVRAILLKVPPTTHWSGWHKKTIPANPPSSPLSETCH